MYNNLIAGQSVGSWSGSESCDSCRPRGGPVWRRTGSARRGSFPAIFPARQFPAVPRTQQVPLLPLLPHLQPSQLPARQVGCSLATVSSDASVEIAVRFLHSADSIERLPAVSCAGADGRRRRPRNCHSLNTQTQTRSLHQRSCTPVLHSHHWLGNKS